MLSTGYPAIMNHIGISKRGGGGGGGEGDHKKTMKKKTEKQPKGNQKGKPNGIPRLLQATASFSCSQQIIIFQLVANLKSLYTQNHHTTLPGI